MHTAAEITKHSTPVLLCCCTNGGATTLSRRAPRVDAETIRSQWGGEHLDFSIVIEGLRRHDEPPGPAEPPAEDV